MFDGFNQSDNDGVRCIIYDAMVNYASEYHPGYVCYDMDMYVALYKCAIMRHQCEHALKKIREIITDDFIGNDELISNFEQFILIKDSLMELDVDEFDNLCMMELLFFKKQFDESIFEGNAGMNDFIPPIPVDEAESNLKKVAQLIVSTDMPNLKSYQAALKSLA